MKASDLFVKALEKEGVEYIFGLPGEENLDILESLTHSKIKLILTRHEQGAGFMAATYGRLTGKPGVCMSTLGPGATNLFTPGAYAQLGAMPMLMITGQKPIKKSKQARFQIIDVVDMMRPITKYTKQIVDGNVIASNIREAFRLATEERPGAVHLELPEDIAQEEVDDHVFDVVSHLLPKPDDAAILAATEMIQKAKMPLLLIGAGANRKVICKALADFVDKTGIFFFTTQMGKGVIDERHPQYLGTAALSSNDFVHAAIDESDLIINVGHDVIEKPPFFMKQGGKKVIHVNFSAAKVKTEVSKHLSKYFEDERFPTLPQRLVNLLRNKLGEKDVITLDNGVYKIWFARNYTCYHPNTLLLDNALATMGAGLPSAMCVKLLYPDKKVIAICGDGGFMMNSQELETAVRLGLNMVVIILNDESYGMIKWKQEDMGFKDFGLDFKNPDFVQYANSYRAHGHRPESDKELQEILDKALDNPGVHVIDLKVDYSLNHPILNVMLKEKISKL